MTIAKGEPWGTTSAFPADGIEVRSDEELQALVERCRRAGETIPPVGLLGGDLCATVGGRGDPARLRSVDATELPMDLGSVLVDGRIHWFAAHLVVRRSWWRGRVLAAMNAQWIGRWDVAPRSHPNDGLLDVFDGDLALDDRAKARRRLPTGTHVPHPGITQRRVAAVQVDLDRPTPVHLDGVRIGPGRSLSIRVEPDAYTCWV